MIRPRRDPLGWIFSIELLTKFGLKEPNWNLETGIDTTE